MNTLAFLGPIGWPEMVILACLGLLIFGKRLPEVGKSLGRGIVSFKKGLSSVEDEIEQAVEADDREPAQLETHAQDQVASNETNHHATA